jgi:transposase
VPRNYGLQTSIISALSLEGTQATMTVEGAVDTDTFNAYIEQVLRPTIRPGDVIVLDNLSAHRASRLETVAEECGAQVLWLAPYSPDSLAHRVDVVKDQDGGAGGQSENS